MQRLCDEGVRNYLGISRLVPERETVSSRSEKSAEAIVVTSWAGEAEIRDEGLKEWEASPLVIETEVSQTFAIAKLAMLVDRVKPDRPRQ